MRMIIERSHKDTTKSEDEDKKNDEDNELKLKAKVKGVFFFYKRYNVINARYLR